MMESWILMVLLASGELEITPQATELACDSNRSAIVKAALAAEHMRTCPEAIAASCVFGMVTNEFLTEGPGQ